MNIEQFRDLCLSKNGVTESCPFGEDVLVFKVMGKMWALCALNRLPTQVNLKCDPERSIQLRSAYDGLIIPGYHMSKEHWNTVMVENAIPPKLLIELIDHSYNLVVSKLTKKDQSTLANL